MKKGILERLAEGPVLGDGGYVLELEKRGYVIAGPFTPEMVLEFPDAVVELHREFLRAGAEVLQAFAFYGTREKLATVGYGDRVLDVNRRAVELARQVAGPDTLVAGNISATWDYVNGDADAEALARRQIEEQLSVQIEAGVDFIIGEIFFNLGEAVMATHEAKKYGLPVMTTMTFYDPAMSQDGKTPAECAKALEDAGADIIGVHCNRGPAQILPVAKEMRDAVQCYVACQAPAYRTTATNPFFTGLPGFPDAMEPYQLTRFEMGDFANQACDIGVNYIGGCCGSVAIHIREMARALGKPVQEASGWNPDYGKPMSGTEQWKAYRAGER